MLVVIGQCHCFQGAFPQGISHPIAERSNTAHALCPLMYAQAAVIDLCSRSGLSSHNSTAFLEGLPFLQRGAAFRVYACPGCWCITICSLRHLAQQIRCCVEYECELLKTPDGVLPHYIGQHTCGTLVWIHCRYRWLAEDRLTCPRRPTQSPSARG